MTDDHLPPSFGPRDADGPDEHRTGQDEQLLAALADELRSQAPRSDGPTEDRVLALRAAVARSARLATEDTTIGADVAGTPASTGSTTPAPAREVSGTPAGDRVVPLADRRPPTRWARVAVTAVAAAAVFVGGMALGAAPPDGLRTAAVAVGLPVDSPAAARLKASVDELGLALDTAARERASGAVSPDTLTLVAETDAAMLDDVRALDDDELAELRPLAHQVHLRAVSVFEEAGQRLPTAQPTDYEELYGSA